MTARRAGAAARAAFTLIEMIVVLGIIMLLMGLVLSGVFSNRKIDRLVATEQMIADVVRQARHAARSTGEPVVVEIRKDAREVAGVSRTPIRCEQFDGGSQPGDIVGNVPGRTGSGFQVQGTSPWTSTLEPYERLERAQSSAHRTPGFYLACDVRTGPPADVVPLVCVADDAVGTFASSACGIALVAVSRSMESTTGGASVASLTAWNVVGWVNTTAGTTWIESEGIPTDLPLDRTLDVAQATFANADPDVFGAMAGGVWEDLGLLFDGERLVLYRNGQRIAERPVDGVTPTSPAHLVDSDHLVAGGVAQFPDGSVITGGVPSSVNAGDKYANAAVLDNVRLFRLTTDQVGVLPSGVAAKLDYRITAHPDGRVEVNGLAAYDAAVGSSPQVKTDTLITDVQRLWFTGTSDMDAGGANLWGVITVRHDGGVSSEVRRENSGEDPGTVDSP